ncbi:unnamed protein product [Amoebophrya sp. A120]|nr:unnamed protein product [Amoebophrya sp. A120]|eukprot:GSA120T00001330001.1
MEEYDNRNGLSHDSVVDVARPTLNGDHAAPKNADDSSTVDTGQEPEITAATSVMDGTNGLAGDNEDQNGADLNQLQPLPSERDEFESTRSQSELSDHDEQRSCLAFGDLPSDDDDLTNNTRRQGDWEAEQDELEDDPGEDEPLVVSHFDSVVREGAQINTPTRLCFVSQHAENLSFAERCRLFNAKDGTVLSYLRKKGYVTGRIPAFTEIHNDIVPGEGEADETKKTFVPYEAFVEFKTMLCEVVEKKQGKWRSLKTPHPITGAPDHGRFVCLVVPWMADPAVLDREFLDDLNPWLLTLLHLDPRKQKLRTCRAEKVARLFPSSQGVVPPPYPHKGYNSGYGRMKWLVSCTQGVVQLDANDQPPPSQWHEREQFLMLNSGVENNGDRDRTPHLWAERTIPWVFLQPEQYGHANIGVSLQVSPTETVLASSVEVLQNELCQELISTAINLPQPEWRYAPDRGLVREQRTGIAFRHNSGGDSLVPLSCLTHCIYFAPSTVEVDDEGSNNGETELTQTLQKEQASSNLSKKKEKKMLKKKAGKNKVKQGEDHDVNVTTEMLNDDTQMNHKPWLTTPIALADDPYLKALQEEHRDKLEICCVATLADAALDEFRDLRKRDNNFVVQDIDNQHLVYAEGGSTIEQVLQCCIEHEKKTIEIEAVNSPTAACTAVTFDEESTPSPTTTTSSTTASVSTPPRRDDVETEPHSSRTPKIAVPPTVVRSMLMKKCQFITHMDKILKKAAEQQKNGKVFRLKVVIATTEVLKLILETKTLGPCTVLAMAEKPKNDVTPFLNGQMKKVLVLDGLTNADNVGSLVRTASCFGIEGILLSKNCCNCWSRRAIRVCMGHCFRIPIFQETDEWPFEKLFNTQDDMNRKQKVTKFAAVVQNHTQWLHQVDFGTQLSGGYFLVMGAEYDGVSDRVRGLCDVQLKIRMAPGCDSFNVHNAASMILHHFETVGLEDEDEQ